MQKWKLIVLGEIIREVIKISAKESSFELKKN
jgi:hypothetical protein